MSVFYSISGSVRVKDTPEMRKLVEAFFINAGEINVVEADHDDGTFTLEIDGGNFTSAPAIIDDQLRAFSPYVIGSGCFYTSHDDEQSEVWVGDPMGDPKEIEKAQRAAFVQEAKNAIKKLTTEEWEELYEEATSPKFWVE